MTVSAVADARRLVEGKDGGTSLESAERLYDFIRAQRPQRCLELGFLYGATSVHIGAALEANGEGTLTGVDIPFVRDERPGADALIAEAGLRHRVELLYEEGGYDWYLRRILREQLHEGRITPIYDFVFLDGAHTWLADGLAFGLVDRLLKPGGWLLLDDLHWVRQAEEQEVPAEDGLSQMREVWDLLVVTHPSYAEFRTDGDWGWARKSPTADAGERVVYKQDLLGSARELSRFARSRLKRGR